MEETQRDDASLPIIDLTSDNASSNSDANHRLEFDLTGYQNQPSSSNITLNCGSIPHPGTTRYVINFLPVSRSNIPVVDLTTDSDQFASHRAPIIDLTDDDIMDITDEIQCIDLTHDNASINDSANFGVELIDLTEQDSENVIPDKSVICLDSDNELCADNGIPDIGDALQNITREFQRFGLTNVTQHQNDAIPATDMVYDNGQNIPAPDLTYRKHCEAYKEPIFDPPPANTESSINNMESVEFTDSIISSIDMARKNTVFRETVDDVVNYVAEIIDSDNLQKSGIENESNENIRYESSNMNLIYSRFELQHQPRTETYFTNHPHENNSEREYLNHRNFEKATNNDDLEFWKPAHQPIPFRHSLGRSTVNTSKNVPFERTEASEGESHILTVSSTFRRRKAESSGNVCHRNQPSLPESPTGQISPFHAVKDIFLKFWIFAFYWILKNIRKISSNK